MPYSMDQNNYIEEKTPKGFTIKIIVDKNAFLVFDPKGSTVYADASGMKILHKITAIAFLGKSFTVRNRKVSDFTFCKVSKGKVIVPFYCSGDNNMRYLLLDYAEGMDLVPVKILFLPHVAAIAREADAGSRPDIVILDDQATDSDIVVIKNRAPSARVIMANEVIKAGIVAPRDVLLTEDKINRAVDVLDEVNLNVMSRNPVFLARVHLRQLDLSKVKQLLLDFDMAASDAGFILSFIDTMLKKVQTDSSLSSLEAKLIVLRDDFDFYVALLNKDEAEIDKLIEKINDDQTYFSFMTLIAKARSMCTSQQDGMLMNEFENKLLEKKETMK
jgi:hypothetical protein